MQIRRFNVSDAFEVSSLIRRSIIYRDNRNYSLNNIYSIANHYCVENICAKLEDKIIYVAIEDEKIIGTATLNKDEIMAVFIDPQSQGKGLGKKFMELLEKDAMNKGLSKVWLVAGLSAVSFYEKIGYKFVSDKFHPEWGRAKYMEKVFLT